MFPFLLTLAATLGPGIQPQLATHEQKAAITYGATGSIFAAMSENGGQSFGAPVKIASGEKLALGRHRGPRIAMARGHVVVSAIFGGELKAWRSADGGKTFTGPVAINDVPNAAREGLHAMAAAGNGSIFAVWLDLRSAGMKLYGSRSTDGGATWSKNTLVYASPEKSICECCHPSIAVSGNEIHVMWRNSLAGNRDMYTARSTDGGKTFTAARKLGNESWKLEACPMDGGGIAVAGSEIVTAWRRGGEIFFSKPGSAEQKIGTGKDASIALGSKGPQVIWSEAGALRGWPSKVDGQGTHPQVISASGRLLAAWESQGSIEVRLLD